jgi:membrane protein DedA with SNARE-associated domain
MSWRSFVLWNALGGISWATGIGLLAYFLGSSAGNAIEAFGIYGLVAALVAVISAVALHRRARRRDAARDDGAGAEAGQPEANAEPGPRGSRSARR